MQNTPTKSAQVRALLSSGMAVADIAKKVGCTPNLVYVVKSKMGTTAKRGPGRPPKAASSSPTFDGISGILDAVKESERERTQLRSALEKIQAVIADALA